MNYRVLIKSAAVFTLLFSDVFLCSSAIADQLTQTFTGASSGELDDTSAGGSGEKWSTVSGDNPPQSAHGVFNTNGVATFAHGSTAFFPSMNLAAAPPGIYTVKLDFDVNAASDDWLGLGFGDAQGNYLTSASKIGPSMLARESRLGSSAFPGPGTSKPPFGTSSKVLMPGTHSMSLSIDTRAANWSVTAFLDGSATGTHLYVGHEDLDQIRSIEIFGYGGAGAAYALQSITTNAAAPSGTPTPLPALPEYPTMRIKAKDQGVVLRFGDGPGECDKFGARDVVVWQDKSTYYMNYDGAGPTGWLVCVATSPDGLNWSKHGRVIDLGKPGSGDSATASYGVPFWDGAKWRLYYLGSDVVSPAPDLIPIGPYHSFEAESNSPLGPWRKRYDLRPFTAGALGAGANSSPGSVVKVGDEYMMFYTGLGIARTHDLDKPWTVDPAPFVSPSQPNENASVYYEPANKTWFLFTNHIGHDAAGWYYTDGIWLFWTKDINHWNGADRAIVLDRTNCTWSKTIIGLPSVLKIGNRLAMYYDAPENPKEFSHMRRSIGLAWLKLPLQVPRPAP